ncbi:MAG: endonuclease III domain-containing protein [Anaerovoracaceae bacterium]
MVKDSDINKILDILEETYPEAECALKHVNTYQLIVAVVLSAQTTDKAVNLVTPALFDKYPTPYELAEAEPEEVAEYIKRIGMYKTKSKNIVGLAKALVENYSGRS